MKTPQKITETTNQRIPRSLKPKVQKKLKGLQSLNFTLDKNVNFSEIEIRITVKGNDIVAAFWNKGVLETQQVLPIKPKPSPPPVDTEINNAINRLQFILNLKK